MLLYQSLTKLTIDNVLFQQIYMRGGLVPYFSYPLVISSTSESNYLSSISGLAHFSDTPPISPSTLTKHNPKLGPIATFIKRQVYSLVDEVIDEEGINDVRHDAFAPWMSKTISDSTIPEDILDQITVEGDKDLRIRIRQLLESNRLVLRKTLSKEPATIPSFDLKVDIAKWNRPA